MEHHYEERLMGSNRLVELDILKAMAILAIVVARVLEDGTGLCQCELVVDVERLDRRHRPKHILLHLWVLLDAQEAHFRPPSRHP